MIIHGSAAHTGEFSPPFLYPVQRLLTRPASWPERLLMDIN